MGNFFYLLLRGIIFIDYRWEMVKKKPVLFQIFDYLVHCIDTFNFTFHEKY